MTQSTQFDPRAWAFADEETANKMLENYRASRQQQPALAPQKWGLGGKPSTLPADFDPQEWVFGRKLSTLPADFDPQEWVFRNVQDKDVTGMGAKYGEYFNAQVEKQRAAQKGRLDPVWIDNQFQHHLSEMEKFYTLQGFSPAQIEKIKAEFNQASNLAEQGAWYERAWDHAGDLAKSTAAATSGLTADVIGAFAPESEWHRDWKETRDAYANALSDRGLIELNRQDQEFAQRMANGENEALAKFKSLINHPLSTANQATQAIPQVALAAATGGLGLGAVNMASSAGSYREEIRNAWKNLSPEQAIQMPQIRQRMAQGMTLEQAIEDASTDLSDNLAGIGRAAVIGGIDAISPLGKLGKGVNSGMLKTFGKEVTKEAAQEAVEQANQNYGVGQIDGKTQLMDDVQASAVAGAVLGVPTGAISGYDAYRNDSQAKRHREALQNAVEVEGENAEPTPKQIKKSAQQFDENVLDETLSVIEDEQLREDYKKELENDIKDGLIAERAKENSTYGKLAKAYLQATNPQQNVETEQVATSQPEAKAETEGLTQEQLDKQRAANLRSRMERWLNEEKVDDISDIISTPMTFTNDKAKVTFATRSAFGEIQRLAERNGIDPNDGNAIREWIEKDNDPHITITAEDIDNAQVQDNAQSSVEAQPYAQDNGDLAAQTRYSRSPIKSVEANIKRGREAMTKAIVERADVKRGMYNNRFGWIDFVWGDDGLTKPRNKKGEPVGKGLAHIFEARARKDNMSYEQVTDMLVNNITETIAKGYPQTHSDNKLVLNYRNPKESNGHQVVLTKKRGGNGWVLTAYERYTPFENPVEHNVGDDTFTPTHSLPTRSRQTMGAGSQLSTDGQVGSNDPIQPTHTLPTRQRQDMGAVGTDTVQQITTQSNNQPHIDSANIEQDRQFLQKILGDAASQIELVSRVALQGNKQNAEGFFENGKAHLVTDNIKGDDVFSREDRLAWVAWHELGHNGVNVRFSANHKNLMEFARTNPVVGTLRRRIQQRYADMNIHINDDVATEEAIVELYAASQTNDWAKLEQDYNLRIHHSWKTGENSVRTFIENVVNKLRKIVGAVLKKDLSKATTADILSLLKQLNQDPHTENVSQGNTQETRFSQRENQDLSEQRYNQAKENGETELTYSQWKQVRSPAFKAWFGDWENDPDNASKVVNPRTGEPLVVYHGTTTSFNEFKTTGVRDAGWYGKGFYATELAENASEYSYDHADYYDQRGHFQANNERVAVGANVMPLYMNVRNPLIYYGEPSEFGEREMEIKRNKNDGVFKYNGETLEEIMVLSPNQVKSAVGNNGEFSTENDDIRYSLRPTNRPKSESLEKLRQAKPIQISGKDIEPSDDIRQYRKNAFEYGKALRGSYINADTGRKINLGRNGITEVLHHDVSNPEHLQSIAAIPQIIEDAIYVDTLPNEDKAKHPDITSYDYYVAGLNIGGGDYTVRAVVANSTTGEKYYDHKLSEIEKGDLLEMTSRLSSAEISNQSPIDLDDKRLLQILQDKSEDKSAVENQNLSEQRYNQEKENGETELTYQQWKQVRSSEFKAWFGDWENDPDNASKIVNPRTGEPLVVYHSTNHEFNIFERDRLGHYTYQNASDLFYGMTAGVGHWFNSQNLSKTIGYGKYSVPAFLNIRSPKEFYSVGDLADDIRYSDLVSDDKEDFSDFDDKEEINNILNEYVDTLKHNHYSDGLIINDEEFGEESYVVFDANQIKSATENNGDFSTENDDIRYSNRQSVDDLVKTGKAKAEPGLFDDLKAKDWEGFKKRINRATSKLDEWFADSLRPVNDWIDEIKGIVPEHIAEQLKGDMYRAKGVRDALNSELEQAYLKPLLRKLAEIASKEGPSGNKSNELDVKRLVGFWLSARYSIERNQRYLVDEKKKMEDAEEALHEAEAQDDPVALDKARDAYRRAERQYRYRKADVESTNFGSNVEKDFKVGTAGGFSIPHARALMKRIETYVSRKDLESVAELVYDLNQARLLIDLNSGRFTQEAYDEYKKDRHYVPLTGDPKADDGFDFIGGAGQNALNIAKDKAHKGRKTSEAEDAIDATWKAVGKTTAYAGMVDFKNRLDEIYENEFHRLREEGFSERSAKKQIEKTLGISKKKMQGTTRTSDNVLIRKQGHSYYEYHLPDDVIRALKRDNVEQVHALLRLVSKPTGWYARGVTQWTLTFSPQNMLRDTWEKSEFIRVQKLYRNGKKVDDATMDRIGRGLLKYAFSDKGLWTATKRFGFGQALREDVEDESLLKRLLELGGVSTYSTYLARTEKDLVKKVKAENSGLGKRLEQVGSILEGYNKTFDTVSSLAAFKSLIKNGIDEKQAAAITLELTNFRKQGSAMAPIKALYMFSQPTAMGARNLYKFLSHPKGRNRFFAYMAVMMPFYFALRAFDDEDEGGNKMDQLGDISRYIPIPDGLGKYIKLPVGFGMPQMAWNFSVNLVKAFAGDISSSEAAVNMLVHTMKTFAPISPSEISAAKYPLEKVAMTATPTILQPLMQIALNRNAFGSQITTNFVRDDKLKAEQAKSTTAQFWKDVALQVHDVFGIDAHPEQIKNLFDGYGSIFGSLKEVQTIFVENPNRELLGRNKRTPFFNQLYGAGNEFSIMSRYYEASDEAQSLFKEYESRKARGKLDGWLTPQKRAMIQFHQIDKKRMAELRAEKSKLTRDLHKGRLTPAGYEARLKLYNQKMDKLQRILLKRWREMNGLNTH
ncbi:hypothetical protein L5B71_03785 [Avibacterium sp. 21-586]|uniref:ADP-ribosyltransferase-containing protein n=1 Tax=Avibacterium sp. 21-586 TaxID=2911534 RepID=UPI002247D6FA|nr:LPD38 domain-containing protein [Avibacterium sp. 21-586]MCW9710011.1 hypothetical protein [Avibacterium sp. 21-586]